jgi:hypothetical protein
MGMSQAYGGRDDKESIATLQNWEKNDKEKSLPRY